MLLRRKKEKISTFFLETKSLDTLSVFFYLFSAFVTRWPQKTPKRPREPFFGLTEVKIQKIASSLPNSMQKVIYKSN